MIYMIYRGKLLKGNKYVFFFLYFCELNKSTVTAINSLSFSQFNAFNKILFFLSKGMKLCDSHVTLCGSHM